MRICLQRCIVHLLIAVLVIYFDICQYLQPLVMRGYLYMHGQQTCSNVHKAVLTFII